jgi:hypothetical protein
MCQSFSASEHSSVSFAQKVARVVYEAEFTAHAPDTLNNAATVEFHSESYSLHETNLNYRRTLYISLRACVAIILTLQRSPSSHYLQSVLNPNIFLKTLHSYVLSLCVTVVTTSCMSKYSTCLSLKVSHLTGTE